MTILFFSCNREDASDFDLQVIADRNVIQAGETVNFTVYHDCENLTFFSGTEGANYLYSASYILSNYTQAQIESGEVGRVDDITSYGFNMSFENFEIGDLYPDKGISVYNVPVANDIAGENYSLVTGGFANLPLITKIVNDYGATVEEDTQQVLWLQNNENVTIGVDKYYVHIDTDIPLTKDKTLKFRLRPTSNTIFKDEQEVVAGEENGYFYFYIRLHCSLKSGKEVKAKWSDNPNGLSSTLRTFKYEPLDIENFHEVQFDLSNLVRNWCSDNGVEEEDIDKVEYIDFNIKGTDGQFYYGGLAISDIEYSGKAVLDFDKGIPVAITNGNGMMEHSYTFDKPGVYEATFVGTRLGSKHDFSDQLGDESSSYYNVNTKTSKVRILVKDNK